MPIESVYLAGPEVFLSDAKDIGKKKKALCRKYGFEGVFPLDVELDATKRGPRELGLCISAINEGLIKTCDIVIANITPFRGPSADVGTVYEIGFAHGLGKRVFAYTNISVSFTERTVQVLKNQVDRSQDGRLRDSQGMFIEEVGFADNLMVDGCINANSKVLVVESAPDDQLYTYLVGFEKCLKAAKQRAKTN